MKLPQSRTIAVDKLKNYLLVPKNRNDKSAYEVCVVSGGDVMADIPEKKLAKGDLATIVEHHAVRNGEDGYSLEAFNVLGDSIAVVTVPESGLAPLGEDEVFNVRSLRVV